MAILAVASALASMPVGAADIITRGADFSVDVSPGDGRIAMDLGGDIWTLPPNGGEARLVTDGEFSLSRPRWSPDGRHILYQSASPDGAALWIAGLDGSAPRSVGPHGSHSQDASWHPRGDRVVYASDRLGAGLDIWETDLPTGVAWRVTSDPGDETEPVWSSNGLHLAWISRNEDGYALVLRRFGEPAITLVEADGPLSSPSWRPDGSLLTFLRHDEDGTTLAMAILSDPVLVREVDSRENYVAAPIAWRDRMNMVYTADGMIRKRGFEDRRSRPLRFRASVRPVPPPPQRQIVRRELTITDAPDGRLIIRGARLFDGIWKGYRREMDVIVEAGRIAAIDARRDRDDGTVLDLGNVTVIPGLIDASSLVVDAPGSGSALLAYGVTTIVTGERELSFDPLTWEGEDQPGPRILQLDASARPTGIVSIADAAAPGIAALLESRQAQALGHTKPPVRRFSSLPNLAPSAPFVVAGSEPNRMAPGIGLHAELRALAGAGLTGEQALHAVGRNAARVLGMENQAGTITVGAVADLVLVAGDPLQDIADAMKIVAVVRNGRFFSLVSLLEMSESPAAVE